MINFRTLFLIVVSLWTYLAPVAQVEALPPKVGVKLLADSTALVPGTKAKLAVAFELEDGWHIYWRNRGEAGKEPEFDWQLPKGFEIGPMQFPAPRRYVEQGGIHTFILEGSPIMLTELKVPQDASAGQTVSISLEVQWFACKTMCYPGNKSLTLKLPVVNDRSQAKPANELEFRIAGHELPQPMAKAKYMKKLWAAANVDKIKPGSQFDVAVVLDVAEGYHINSSKPLSEYLIATDVFHDAVEGLDISRPRFPKGELEPSPMPGEKQSVYRGRTVILLSVQADNAIKGEKVSLSGVVTYQACSDKTKQCYAPTSAEWEVVIPIAKEGEKVSLAHNELFKTAQARAIEPAESLVKDVQDVTPPQETSTQKPEGQADVSASKPSSMPTSDTWLGKSQRWLADRGIIGFLIMAFIGGFILNLMPCVLPVISIKILSFVQQSKESRLRVFTLGLAFSFGILMSFVVLGILIVFMGQQWGGLFQRPQVVIGLAAVVTAFALSLFGVFTLYAPKMVGELGEKVQQEGHLSSFGMGILATVLGTACTAPFLALVVAIASQQPSGLGMLIFIVAGIGMAFPYVLLAAKPVWLRFIPKPGPWMKTFEQVMGFVLLATVIWLFNTVGTQLGSEGMLWVLLFLLFVGVAAWFYGKVEFGASLRKKVVCYSGAAVLLVGGWVFCFQVVTTIPELIIKQRNLLLGGESNWLTDLNWSNDEIPWVRYTRDRARKAVASGRTVFIDYTAEWCGTCKANEKAFINTKPVRESMKRLKVIPFKADYTLFDPEIKKDLEELGSGGVPMYLIIPANRPDGVIRLDEVITSSYVVKMLEKAAAGSDASALAGS